MIKAEDLRIGNKILMGETEIVVTANILDKISNEKSLIKFYPIELTPDWLVKLGFYRSSSLSELWSYGNTMLIWRTEYESEELDNYYEFRFGITDSYGAFRQVRLDYVHQLQNLTYALTGQDLTLSSPV